MTFALLTGPEVTGSNDHEIRSQLCCISQATLQYVMRYNLSQSVHSGVRDYNTAHICLSLIYTMSTYTNDGSFILMKLSDVGYEHLRGMSERFNSLVA